VGIDEDKIERIVIIRLSAIGDVVRTIPALGLLREKYPDAHIAWVVEELAYDILSGRSDIDEVILLPLKSLWKKLKSPRHFFGAAAYIMRFIRDLRSKKFQVSFDFQGLLKSGVVSFLTGAPIRIGFDRGFSKEGSHIFSNVRVRLPVPKLSRIERNLILARRLVGDIDGPETLIETTAKEKSAIDLLEREKLSDRRPRIIVHPGTSPRTPYKKWRADGFAKAADLVLSRLGGEVIVTYGPGEEGDAVEVRDLMVGEATVLAEPLSLLELAEFYKRSDIYIGGDTGPMHIASFVKTPVVAVFGPTDPVENEPYTKTPHKIVRIPVECSPCRERRCKKGICFKDITPEMVADAAIELLADRKGRGD
jgi:lipopolysaccharide heptosyltransferase II